MDKKTSLAYPPRIVAVPPTYAVRDMCVLANGEIRHYGWKNENGEKRRVYISSVDNGETWRTEYAAEGDCGPMVKIPWSDNWIFFQLGKSDDSDTGETYLLRSKIGPGDTAAEKIIMPWPKHGLRQLIALRNRKRLVAAFSDVRRLRDNCYNAAVAYSDDDGLTWTHVEVETVKNVPRLHPGDKRPHWFNSGCEPSITELNDGRILMALRTSGEHHAFCESNDGGETWSEPKESDVFWAANTMPYLFRLKDGRLMFFWNNTAMLPTRSLDEYPELGPSEKDGTWEVVFTNRDALHAAISDDDGKTWKGFREIALTEPRNCEYFRELGRGEEDDKSIHQSQAVELPDGKVLLSYGQNSAARRIAIIDPDWLLETERSEDFRDGLKNISNHLYVKSLAGGFRGWAGHCAFNRVPGALMVRDPDTDNGVGSNREVLQLCRIRDPRLVSDQQGVVWNFPSARSGRLEIECRIEGEGFQLTLADHWMNPCDEVGPGRSPLCTPITGKEVMPGAWRKLVAEWNCGDSSFVISVDGQVIREGKLKSSPRFGISYLHLQTLAEETDSIGTYLRSFHMTELFSNKDAVDPSAWHGVNLLGMFSLKDAGDKRVFGNFPEDRFRWLEEWGFNFARLPMDYRYFLEIEDWTKLKQEGFRNVDDAVRFGIKHRVHVQICLHRAPGFTIASWALDTDKKLQTDKEPQEAFIRIWTEFARRYKGIPNKNLSFNLINEPCGFSEQQYIDLFGRTIDAIRKEDPGRFVMLDGNNVASTPVKHFFNIPQTGQAFRGYTPHAISHYGAWYIKTQPKCEPSWPCVPGDGDDPSSWIWEQPEKTVEKWIGPIPDSYPRMIGEFGVYNKISHVTALKWMEYCLQLWQSKNVGWAIWNLDGPFGFLDSERKDVEYEDFEGHKLDRAMLDLLRKYALRRSVLELPPGPDNCRNSEGAFIELKDGRILFAYSKFLSGNGGDHDQCVIAARLSSDHGDSWSKDDRIVAVNETEKGGNVMSVSLFRTLDGRLGLLYSQKETDAGGYMFTRKFIKFSTDEGETWNDTVECTKDIPHSYRVVNNSRILRLKSGRLLIPCADHGLHLPGKLNLKAAIGCFISDDDGLSWRVGGLFKTYQDGVQVLTQEPGVVELNDGRVLIYVRTDTGRQWCAYSCDGAETWSEAEPMSLYSPVSPATIIRIRDGRLMAVWNDHEDRPDLAAAGPLWEYHGVRTPLTVGFSDDDGKTWKDRINIEDGYDPNDVARYMYCYTAVLELDDRFLLAYCAEDCLRHSRLSKLMKKGICNV